MKPRQAPVRAARITDTTGSATSRETISMEVELMAATPTARPSSPSIRFMALVQPTIHRIVSGTDRKPISMVVSSAKTLGLEITSNTRPERTATMAASS